MKMIPLVMANEPGKAQVVNRELLFLNCSLEGITSVGPSVSLFGRKRQRG